MSRRHTVTARDIVSNSIAPADIEDRFSEVAIHKDDIDRRIKQLADEALPSVAGKLVTFVILGNGALSFGAQFLTQKPFKGRCGRPLFIRASGYNGTTPGELYHDASSIKNLATDYARTEVFVLLDEVRHTGQSMFKMKRFFEGQFARADVLTVSLIDRPDCVESAYRERLDLTGFCLSDPRGRLDRAERQGWLVGFGMDIHECFRELKSVRWTLVEPHPSDPTLDVFRLPKKGEMPEVHVPGGCAVPVRLKDWKEWSNKKEVTRAGR